MRLDEVAFLSGLAAKSGLNDGRERRETHMSWVFFVGDTVYKLKKPVRLPYLDFSTLARREAACRAEFKLNRRLAPGVYLGVEPLVASAVGLRIGGPGEVVDWLVVMRRLDEAHILDRRLENHVTAAELDRLAAVLVRFYRHAERVHVSSAVHLADWARAIDENERILLTPRLGLPGGLVRSVGAVQRRFLRRRGALIARRVRDGRILDAHGDLRPEHICLNDPIKIIDCLEFSSRLRANDPLDETAFLDLECERLGAPEAGARVAARVARALNDPAPPALYLFYRSYRAMLRARLSIAHLLEPSPRTPEKWPAQARTYLALARRDAQALERRLRTPGGR